MASRYWSGLIREAIAARSSSGSGRMNVAFGVGRKTCLGFDLPSDGGEECQLLPGRITRPDQAGFLVGASPDQSSL